MHSYGFYNFSLTTCRRHPRKKVIWRGWKPNLRCVIQRGPFSILASRFWQLQRGKDFGSRSYVGPIPKKG